MSNQLKTFWAIDEDIEEKHLTLEEKECKERYINDIIVRNDGKFQVKLPFKISPNSDNFLGGSYNQAKMRLFHLEKRFERDSTLKEKYSAVINEYLTLGHMHEATAEELKDTNNLYITPHHAVIKELSSTTQLRVVFDASAKTTNGMSLNDQLLIGPTVQEDIFSILIRWRIYKYGFTSDIEKMYRQIFVDPEHAKFQRILWRNKPDEQIKQYILDTVTFGTASAPYQATRALIKIADGCSIKQANVTTARAYVSCPISETCQKSHKSN